MCEAACRQLGSLHPDARHRLDFATCVLNILAWISVEQDAHFFVSDY